MKKTLPLFCGLLFLTVTLMVEGQTNGFTWTSDGTNVTISGYTGASGVVTVPGVVSNMPVTAIAANAFGGNTVLTNVTVPGSVASIGSGAFGSCLNLTGVTLSNGLATILDSAFFNCTNLVSVTLPGSVTNMGNGVFAYCTSLTNVTIPGSLGSIPPHTFNYCLKLTSITIPAGIGLISTNAFQNCGNLASVTLPGSVTNIADSAFYACVHLASITIPGGVTNIGPHAFALCLGLNSVFFKGNAPGVTNIVFDSVPAATAYYLPGTTGWGATFDGIPAVLWNPQITSAVLQNSGFVFNITGTSNIPVVLEATTNLTATAWQPLLSCTVTNGLVPFVDSNATNYPVGFYRIRSP
jgi:hypothetical protein